MKRLLKYKMLKRSPKESKQLDNETSKTKLKLKSELMYRQGCCQQAAVDALAKHADEWPMIDWQIVTNWPNSGGGCTKGLAAAVRHSVVQLLLAD